MKKSENNKRGRKVEIEDEILREKICRKCEFYKEGEKLECYAYKLSKKLIEEGKIKIDEI